MTMASREISRLVAIFATILLIQIAIVPHFRISGYIIDLPLVVVVLVAVDQIMRLRSGTFWRHELGVTRLY